MHNKRRVLLEAVPNDVNDMGMRSSRRACANSPLQASKVFGKFSMRFLFRYLLFLSLPCLPYFVIELPKPKLSCWLTESAAES